MVWSWWDIRKKPDRMTPERTTPVRDAIALEEKTSICVVSEGLPEKIGFSDMRNPSSDGSDAKSVITGVFINIIQLSSAISHTEALEAAACGVCGKFKLKFKIQISPS
ncbi:hypothetical protein Dimus_034253 [Dionaea muscipula]